jgi:cell division inhibitor SepF
MEPTSGTRSADLQSPDSRQPEVAVITPGRFEDAMAAVQEVQRQKTVVLHLGAMQPEEAQRTIDFVSGGVFAMDGQSERLGDTVFLFAPARVTIHRDPGLDGHGVGRQAASA